jgi:inorganic pyrophosphatase
MRGPAHFSLLAQERAVEIKRNLEALPIGEETPRVVNAVIEVPVGSRNKYEYEPGLGVIMRDRVLPGAVRYPTDYGFVPSTLTGRDDALDIVVAAYDPAFPGCVVRVRPIGALHIADSQGEEHNVYAVPDDDPRFADIRCLEDLPEQNLREIEEFFEVYKRLEGDKEVEIRSWLALEETHDLIRRCCQAYIQG